PIEEIGAPYATPIDEDDIDLGEPMPPYDGEPVYDDDEHIDSTDVPDSLIAAVSTDQPAVVDVPRGAAEASEAPVDIATKVADVATESAIEDLHEAVRKRRTAKPKADDQAGAAAKPKAPAKRARKAQPAEA